MHERVIGEEINAEDVREGDLIDCWRGSTIHVERVERPSQVLVCLYSPQGQRYDFAYRARVKLLGEQNDQISPRKPRPFRAGLAAFGWS